jgi:hypothetical protein
VSLQGFAPAYTSVTLNSGQSATLSPIAIKMNPITVSVDVVATQQDIAAAQLHFEEQQRLIGIFPNFFVTYDSNAVPLTTKQKFSLALRSAADPGNLLLVGTVAGVQQAANSFPGYGQGIAGYGRRYGADLGNLVSGTFVSEAILPTLFRQDTALLLQRHRLNQFARPLRAPLRLHLSRRQRSSPASIFHHSGRYVRWCHLQPLLRPL